jgi:hypothetical protein
MTSNTTFNVSYRAKQITKRINLDFRGVNSDTRYSLFVGSYGRGTEIHTSDIDTIIELPYSIFQQYDGYIGNGQSALLQSVKNSLQNKYSTTHMRGDGQVIALNFNDGICYEIVPAFLCTDGESYLYPDTNNGGSWKVTNPRAEIRATNSMNNAVNKNLKRLCRMARAWKQQWDVSIGGLLLDTLAYRFISDWMTRDFFAFLKDQSSTQDYWLAPGSSQYVCRKGNFEYKALRAYNTSLEAIAFESNNHTYSANLKWREIYGSKFPT